MDRATQEQEVAELTALLRTDEYFQDLRNLLAGRGHAANHVVLAGLIEGEDGVTLGAFALRDGTCVLFETASDGTLLRWVEPARATDWADAFGAVEAGIDMARANF